MMKKSFYLVLAIFFCSAFSVLGQKAEISLDGKWEIVFDENNEGLKKEWYKNEVFEKLEFKKSIQVPSCWEEYRKDYEGVGIYRREFNVPKEWEGQVIELNFDASNYKTEVWLNDEVVGFHEGGYTPFSLRVDKMIKPGQENVIVVRVVGPIILTDQRIDGLGRQEVPMWRGAITGGIWQSVSLSSSGKSNIEDVFIEPDIKDKSAKFNLQLENTRTVFDEIQVRLEIKDRDKKLVVEKVENITLQPGKSDFVIKAEIPGGKLWSVERPYLYAAQISVLAKKELQDAWSSKFGIREFSVINDEFVLNGKPLYLKAAFFEGLYPVKLAYPDRKEMAIKEIMLAKEAGFNMIRPWRKPAPDMWLDICDSVGMLTVGSLAIECMHRPVSTPRLPFVVENELRKTILSNRNRTCIVQWELFNEINRPVFSQMLNEMSLLARELDPTRMILDESGGWGEGTNIYLPYERTPQKINDIHHYSGSQITEKEFNAYLSIAKTEAEKEALGFENVPSPGKNVVPGMMSYVSELGYGSMPDLTLNNKLFREKGNPIVAPARYHIELEKGIIYALEKTGFDEIYPDVRDFYLEQQKMHGIANKRMLEATRCNELVKGYCVHALTGGDWVIGAGLLDLWRNPKTDVYAMTKEANQPRIIPVRVKPRNIYADQGTEIEVLGVNELADTKGELVVKIEDSKGKKVFEKAVAVNLKKGINNLFSEKINTSGFQGNYSVYVVLTNAKGEDVLSSKREFDVFTPEDLTFPGNHIAVAETNNHLKTFLESRGLEVIRFSKDLSSEIPVIVGKKRKGEAFNELASEVEDFVKNGGYAVFLDVPGKTIPGKDRELREISESALPTGVELHGKWTTLGGWAGKPHIVKQHPVFRGLPVNQIMHGVYENVHPVNSMSKQAGTYIAGLIGYDHFPNQDIMVRHFIGPGEVWWAADVLEVESGKGKMLMSTLRIIDNLGKDPVAEKLLCNYIRYAQNQTK